MQISIKLSDPDRVPFWGLVGRFQLTANDPGPMDIIWDHLMPAEKRQVIMGARYGQIEIDKDIDELVRSIQSVPIPIETPSKSIQEIITPDTPQQVLNKSPKQVKEMITDSTDLRFIRNMLELEAKGKKRKSILSFLQEKISNIETSVQQSLKKGLSLEIPMALEKDPFVSEVTDTEVYKIKVGVPIN
jgi:hypothetical protein